MPRRVSRLALVIVIVITGFIQTSVGPSYSFASGIAARARSIINDRRWNTSWVCRRRASPHASRFGFSARDNPWLIENVPSVNVHFPQNCTDILQNYKGFCLSYPAPQSRAASVSANRLTKLRLKKLKMKLRDDTGALHVALRVLDIWCDHCSALFACQHRAIRVPQP